MTITAAPKFGQQGSWVPFLPPSPDFRQDLFAISRHLLDASAGQACLLVPRPPDEQLQKHRRQINPPLGQPVVYPACVRFLYLRDDNPGRFELPQTIRQDVGGNPFARSLKLLECSEPAHHQIANNEQRPAVSQHLERDTHGAARPASSLRLPRHIRHPINIACKTQAIFKTRGNEVSGHLTSAAPPPTG